MQATKTILAGAVAAALFGSAVHAQPADKYIVGTGSKTGTYFSMMTDVASKCPGLEIKEEVGGTLANLANASAKRIDLFVGQSDAFALAQRDNPSSYKGMMVVAGLHNEEVQVFALPDLVVAKNVFGRGGRPPSTLADLAKEEIKIGAWGGSLKTADTLNRSMAKRIPGWKPNVVSMTAADESTLMTQMKAVGASVVIRTSGTPDSIFEKLPANSLRPIAVDTQIVKDYPDSFTTSSYEYQNLSRQTVGTIAVQALLIARRFDDPADIARITALRDCIEKNLSTFRNGRGFHWKWADVNLKTRVNQPMFPPSTPVR